MRNPSSSFVRVASSVILFFKRRSPPPPTLFAFFLSSSSPLFSLLLSVSFLEALILAPPRCVNLARRTWISRKTRWRSVCAVPLVKRSGGGLDLVSDLVLWRALLLPMLPLFDFLGKGEMVRLAEGVRVPQTVELRCFFRPFRWSPARPFLGRSTVLVGPSMVLLSFSSRFGLLQVLCSRGVCEKARSWVCQPQQPFSVAARLYVREVCCVGVLSKLFLTTRSLRTGHRVRLTLPGPALAITAGRFCGKRMFLSDSFFSKELESLTSKFHIIEATYCCK
ncbi:hypothetical protein YC2023_086638 [Brassica napus]